MRSKHLLSTKIQVPPLPLKTVQRTRLMEALDHGLQPNIRVTLISAPAGYGKTTLLSGWIQSRDLTSAWLSISDGDNDPTRFTNYLAAALETSISELDLPSPTEDQVSQEAFQQQFLIPLINQISQMPQQTVIVMDDYHLIQSSTVHDLTSYLLEHLPSQAHLYLATRADPPLPIARLRGRGQVNELRMEDLRFQIEEVESLLSQADLRLTSDDIQTLYRRTEGWISGLQMAAASLQGHEDVRGFIDSFSGSHHYIMEYLLDEVLRRQPEEIQSFLLETSILERLCGPVCDVVRATPSEFRFNSHAILRRLEQANLFIVPLDSQREWYRYHRLFSDLLQGHLQRKAPTLLPELHRRASAWFEDHRLIDEAVRHALLAGDDDFAATTVERHAQEVLLRGETATFLRWVQRLPDEQIQMRPKLGIYRAWALLLQGAPLSAVEAQIKESRARRGPAGSSRSLEAFILLFQGQLEQGLGLAEQALELLPSEEVYLRNFAAICVASSRISLGDVDGGLELMEQTAETSQSWGSRSATVMILCELAELRRKQLQLNEAEKLYQKAIEIGTDRSGNRLPIVGNAIMGLGQIALERYDLKTAEGLILEGIQLSGRWSLLSTMDGHHALAILYDILGEEDSLEETLDGLDDLCRRFDASDLDDIVVEMLRVSLNLRHGKIEPVREWIYDRDLDRAPAKRPAWYDEDNLGSRLYKYQLPLLARWHLAEGRYEDALEVLEELDHLAEAADRAFLLLESYILKARACHSFGDHDASLHMLKQALERALPQRARRLFLTEGDDVIQLLENGLQQWDDPDIMDFAQRLLNETVAQSPEIPSTDQAIVEPLSPRELEVLRLLPTPLTADELADELFVSVNTVRSHLKSIYAKLDVHSRHEAVAKASQLDLL